MSLQQKDGPRNWLMLYILWLVPVAFSGIWLIYFKNAGLGNLDIILPFLAWPVCAVITILLFNFAPRLSRNILLLGGIFSTAMSFLVIPLFAPSSLLLALSFLFYGLSVFLFWVPFNIKYFGFAGDSGAASSAIYFAVGGLLSLLLVVVGGVVFEFLGPGAFFFSAGLLYVLPALATTQFKDEAYKHDLLSSIEESKGFRTLSFIDGTSTGVLVAGTVISLFYFINQPFYFSLFIAFVTFFSILASFFVSRLSDRTKKRKAYIIVFGTLSAISTAAMGFAWGISSWIGLSAVRNFFFTLFSPFTTAIFVDSRKELQKLMVGRELFLNLGRIFGISLVALSQLIFSDVRPSLIILGMVALAYPLVLHLKKSRLLVL